MSNIIEQIRQKLRIFPPSGQVHSFRKNVREDDIVYAEPSAVLVAIQKIGDGYSYLLTKRSAQLRDHAGQVSFVGGKQSAEDRSFIDTAIREGQEEIGILPEKVQVLGTLDRILVAQKFLVTPVVAFVDSFPLMINPAEVEQVFYLPLSYALNDDHYYNDQRFFHYQGIQLDFEQYNIWGGTASILLNLKNIINYEHKTTNDYSSH